MKVLVIGSGGREHAICYGFAQSSKVSKLYCAPGNAGIAEVAECVAIKQDSVSDLADFAEREAIDLTFVGGETPLALGIVDEFNRRGLKIIGATRNAARLESSKVFAKEFMARHGIPTARFYSAVSADDAVSTLESGLFGDVATPVVVKADGLAAGKGVVVARNRTEAISACRDLAALVGADAAQKIVLEEFLDGREVSLLMFADGENFALMPPVRDHKRIGEGDTGPNTGGMGTITDDRLLTPEEMQTVIADIVRPTLRGCIEEGFPFRGIMFVGLMMVNEGAAPRVREDAEQLRHVTATPKVLEYNVRFGDPETQAIMVRLKSDLVDICCAIDAGTLSTAPIEWSSGNSACVVLAAAGYPQQPRTGDVIAGIDDAKRMGNVTIFHAGTAIDSRSSPESGGPSFATAGGRILGVTATGADLDEALARAYSAVAKIEWSGMQFRRDIGRSA